MIEDLNWNNFIKLNDYIKSKTFALEYFSTIQLIQWTYYGSLFKYRITKDAVIFYIKTNNEKWKLFSSFYQKQFNLNLTKQIIKKDLIKLNQKSIIEIIDFSKEAINSWKLDRFELIESNYVSNYIYDLNALKTFVGKKMVKKRNHLNAFLRNNYNLEVKNLKHVDVNEVINFTKYLNQKYDNEIREIETKIYHEFLQNQYQKDNRFKGTAYYIENKLVGYTFGFLNNDTYEIIIEKAEKDIRGLYPFILKTNLNFHKINCKYVDWEDDLGKSEIAKSKLSYHPIEIVKRFSIKNVNW